MDLALEDKTLRELLMIVFFKEMFFQENCFSFESIAPGEKTFEVSGIRRKDGMEADYSD